MTFELRTSNPTVALRSVAVPTRKAGRQRRRSMYGKRVVITGTLRVERFIAAADVHDAGGIFQTAVNARTDYLVVGSNMRDSRKLRAARSCGVEILTEREFWDAL